MRVSVISSGIGVMAEAFIATRLRLFPIDAQVVLIRVAPVREVLEID